MLDRPEIAKAIVEMFLDRSVRYFEYTQISNYDCRMLAEYIAEFEQKICNLEGPPEIDKKELDV